MENLENVKEGCIRMLLWGIGEGDNCNYPTKVGTIDIIDYPFFSPWRGTYYRNLKLWKEKGWDSLRTVREYAKTRKWEFQVYIRIEGFSSQFPFDKLVRSNFFLNHPEYHCRDREGQRVGRLSYAYPEVQDHMLKLIKEIADYDPDGICLAFNRGVPVVLYEPIMVEGFMNKYGTDPRTRDEFDPDWLDYQAEVFTPFMRKAKAILEKHQRLSAIVPANEHDCRRWGLAVATWVKEGIIDDLIPVGQRYDEMDAHRDDPDNLDFDYFSQLEGRERIRLIPMLYTWTKLQTDPQGWRTLLYSFLDRGADAYAVWDAADFPEVYAKVADIGYETRDDPVIPETRYDGQEVKVQFGGLGGASETEVELPPERLKITSMGGFRYDRYHYFEVI